MHSKSDNIEIMTNDEADEFIKELFDSLKNRYQNNLESVKGSEFLFNYVYLLYYECHKINPNHGGPHIDSPDWIKKAIINLISRKYNICFQYAVTVALNDVHSMYNLKYGITKNIPIAFHNGSNYDYHFIRKVFAEESTKKITCLGENTEKYIIFTVTLDKEVTGIGKNGEETTKNIFCIV